ncbi:GNAT family N-acetyltransferase, partial [candidate division KSB1 bacterium]|nr:GNAT family N-acetyltransferase [candidate division KSB1 bacterium]
NLQDKHKTSPVHTLKELFDLKQRLPERVRLFAAYVQDKMIGGILLFICNAQAALAFYISQLAEYQQYRPVNLLCYETAQWCAEQELAYFDFGTSTLRGEINWGLVDFRQAAGAQAAFRDRMRLDL